MAEPRSIDVAAFLDKRPLDRFSVKLILISWLITLFDGFDMLMISYTAPWMRDELGLSPEQLGTIFSAGLFGMMVGGFVFSYVGDRFGRRKTIVCTAFAFSLLTLATALAHSYEQLVLLRFVNGMAIGGMLPLAWALNIEFVPQHMRSTVVTMIMVGYSLGSSLAGPVTIWLAPDHGWQSVFVFGGVCSILSATLLLLWLPESVRFLASKQMKPDLLAATLNRLDPALEAKPTDHFHLSDERHDSSHFTVSKLFEGDLRWLTPLLWAGYIASTLAVYFKANWGPIVYEEMHFSRETAAYVSSISGFLGAVLGLLLMRITDRRGPLAVALYPLLAAPILLLLGFGNLAGNAFLVVSLLATTLVGGSHFGILSIASVYYPTAIRANGGGWATSVAKIGGIAGPMIGGHVIASGMPIVHTFSLLAICPLLLAACAIGIAWIVARRNAVSADAPPADVASETSVEQLVQG